MSKIERIKLQKLIHKIGLDFNLPDNVIKTIVESPYEFTAIKANEIKFDEIKSEEDLQKEKTNFLYKGFGKLYVNFLLLNRRIKRRENLINLNKSNGRIK